VQIIPYVELQPVGVNSMKEVLELETIFARRQKSYSPEIVFSIKEGYFKSLMEFLEVLKLNPSSEFPKAEMKKKLSESSGRFNFPESKLIKHLGIKS
jgi:hypothetical protein